MELRESEVRRPSRESITARNYDQIGSTVDSQYRKLLNDPGLAQNFITGGERSYRLFTQECLGEIRTRRAEQTILPTAEEDGMFLDPLEELYRKPDPTLADGQSLTSTYGRFPPELLGCQIEDIDFYYRSKKTFCVINRRFGKRYINRFTASKSLYLFSPFNPVRKAAIRATINPVFDVIIIFTILVNCVFLALDDPIDELEFVFTAIYTLEVVIKVVARGFILNKFTYLRDPWNWLDFIVVGLAYVTMMTDIGNVSGLRTFRVLRAFKSLSIVPGLKTIVNALFLSMKPLSEVLFIMVFLLVVIALIGLQSYMGVLKQKCVLTPPKNISNAAWFDWVQDEDHLAPLDEDTVLCGNATGAGRCDEGYSCLPDIGENPSYGYTAYDNMGLALLTSFQLLTLDFWENTYNMILRASGTWNVIYFILVILLGPFYLLNLLLAVVTMAYSKEHEKQEELRELRKRAKERARVKAMRRMKHMERQNTENTDDDTRKPGEVWAATISSTRIGLGVGIPSRSASDDSSPQHQSRSASDNLRESVHSPVSEQPSQTSWSTSAHDSFDLEETTDECIVQNLRKLKVDFNTKFCSWDCPSWFKSIQEFLQLIVNSKAFEIFIVICIIVNTVFLALDHHDADDNLKHALSIGNTVFTYIFAHEALLKIVALGFVTYLKDPWNTFDFIIVILSLSDVIISMTASAEDVQNSGLNVLRTLRLLRVFRLAQMWGTMRRLLSIIAKSIMDVGYLTIVLFIVLYIFAVIGKQLYSEKYKNLEKLAEMGLDRPPKWNFTDFVFSFLMVFRVLCGEWVEPLWDCMFLAEPTTCIVFFLLITFVANFMVFNLFIAILLEAFSVESLNEKSEVMQEKVKRKRMRAIKTGLERIIGAVKDKTKLIRNLSRRATSNTGNQNGMAPGDLEMNTNTFMEQDTQRSVTFNENVNTVNIEPDNTEENFEISETSADRSNRDENPMDGNHRKGQRFSAASVDGLIDGLDLKREKEEQSKLEKKKKYDEQAELESQRRIREQLRNIKPPNCGPKFLDESGCYITSAGMCWGKFRSGVYYLAKHPYFEYFILFLIAASTICLAMEDKSLQSGEKAKLKEVLSCLELIFAILFTMEMLMKWIGFGLWDYFTEFWTILDFIIVAISWIGIGANASGATSLRSLRTLRALRPLRAISRWESMKVVVNALIHCIPAIGNVICVCLLFWLVFGIMGVQFFAGKFFYCRYGTNHTNAHDRVGNFSCYGPDSGDDNAVASCTYAYVTRPEICGSITPENPDGFSDEQSLKAILGDFARYDKAGKLILPNSTLKFCTQQRDPAVDKIYFGDLGYVEDCFVWSAALRDNINTNDVLFPDGQLEWEKPGIHFDSAPMAMLALFQVATFEGWMEVMDSATDARAVGQQPAVDANLKAYWYFMAFILVGAFFILNLIVGVIIESFQTLSKDSGSESAIEILMTEDQKNYVKTMRTLFSTKPKKAAPPPNNSFQGKVYNIVTKPAFELSVFGLICLNMVALGCEHYNQSDSWIKALLYADVAFTTLFLFECVFKIIGLRAYYFRDPFNVFDFIVIVLSAVGLILENLLQFFVSPTLLRVVRVFRIFRVLRVIKAARGIRRLMITLMVSIPALLNIAVLLFLGMVIFSILGMSSFMNVRQRGALNDMVNFETFPNSMLLLFRLMTSAGWNDVLDPLMSEHDCSKERRMGEDDDQGDCGKKELAIFFFIVYILVVFLIIINMYIAVILENFDEIFQQDRVGIADEDYEFFYSIWGKFDPKATQFVHIDKMPDLLHALPKPFKVPKPNEIKIAALQLPVMEGGRVHCLDVLYALTKRLLGEIEVSKDMLKEVQKQLERAFPDRKLMFPVTTTLEIRQELKAATVIQRAYRAWKDRVSKNKLGQFPITVQSHEDDRLHDNKIEESREPVDKVFDNTNNISM